MPLLETLLVGAISALGGGGVVAAILNYRLGQRTATLAAQKQTSEADLAGRKLELESEQLIYTRLLQEVGRLQGRADSLEARAEKCEERERAHEQESAAKAMALQGEINDLRGDLSRIIHRSLVAVITADASGRIVSWSSPAERLFGWKRSEVEGREHITILVPPHSRDAHEKAFREAATAPEFPEKVLREAEALHKDSTRIPVRIHLSRRENAAGEYIFTAEITLR